MSQLESLKNEIVKVSNLYSQNFKIERDKDWYILKLQEEMGELSKAYINYTGRGKSKDGNFKKELIEELADVFAHLILLCDSLGVDIDEAIQQKWLRHLANKD